MARWLRSPLLGVAAIVLFSATPARDGSSAELETVRIGVLKFGTVNWELDVIRHHGLAEGIRLDVVELAGKPATRKH